VNICDRIRKAIANEYFELSDEIAFNNNLNDNHKLFKIKNKNDEIKYM
jgi:hypothetical protein